MSGKHSATHFAATTALPVIVAHGCLFPFWLAHVYASGAWLPLVAILLTGLLAPAYLAVRGCQLVRGRFAIRMSLGFGMVLVVFALNFLLDYSAWGISSRQFWTPDEGTIEIEHLTVAVAAVILLLPLLFACLAASLRRRA